MTKNQIKSKHRVTKHGEVFTHEREVNAMLDLVKNETVWILDFSNRPVERETS